MKVKTEWPDWYKRFIDIACEEFKICGDENRVNSRAMIRYKLYTLHHLTVKDIDDVMPPLRKEDFR